MLYSISLNLKPSHKIYNLKVALWYTNITALLSTHCTLSTPLSITEKATSRVFLQASTSSGLNNVEKSSRVTSFKCCKKQFNYVIQSSFNPLTIKASPVTFRGTCDDPVLVNICTNKSLSLSASTTDDKANTTLFACALNRILVLNSVWETSLKGKSCM